MAEAGENSKCIICRKHLLEIKKEPDPESSQGWQFYYWKNECAKSICEILLGRVSLPFVTYFQRGEYCSPCLQTLRDIHFTWKQLKGFEDKINKLAEIVQNSLTTNYKCIEQKTSISVVEERASVALNVSDKSRNFLDNYSYDEIVEMIYSVSSKLTSHTVETSSQEEDQHSLAESLNQSTSKVKLENYVNGIENLSGGPTETFENDLEDGLNTAADNDTEAKKQIKRNPVTVRKALTEREPIHNWDEILGDILSFGGDTSDNDGYISDGVMASKNDSQLKDSWGPLSSQKSSPSRISLRLSLRREEEAMNKDESVLSVSVLKKRQKTAGRTAKDKPKQKEDSYKSLSSELFECPVCHKRVTNHSRAAHERLHTGEKPFSCSDCGKTFNSQSTYIGHMKKVHGKLNPTGMKIKHPFEAAKVANAFASRRRRYHCDLCSWTFRCTFRYLRHLKNSHLNKDIQDGHSFNFHYCDADDCLYSFTSQASLSNHISEMHRTNAFNDVERKPSLECGVCKRIFVQQNNLEMHMKSHGTNQFGCDYCHLTFSSKTEVEYHKPRHEIVFRLSDYCHVCEDCGEGFKDIEQLRKHVASLHSGVPKRKRKKTNDYNTTDPAFNRSVCKICHKATYGDMGHEYHMYSHTHPNGFQCSKCPAVKKLPKSLERHEKRHLRSGVKKSGKNTRPSTKQVCDICGKEVFNLETHRQTHSNPEGFQCSQCGKIKKTLKLLHYHEKRSHLPDSQLLPAKLATESTKCEVCDKKFGQKSRYRRHIVYHHPEEIKSTHPYVCKFCWFVFEKEEDKNAHVEKKHVGYTCSFEGCGQKFGQRNHLASHLNVHYKQKPYLCPYCGKGFANNGNCLSHVHMVHTKHRSLRCKLCPDNEGYYVKKEFIKHVEKVHLDIHPENYKTILDHRKPDVPVKIEWNKALVAPYYPPSLRSCKNRILC